MQENSAMLSLDSGGTLPVGVNQAASRLGGGILSGHNVNLETKRSRDPRNKTYNNAVRLVLDQNYWKNKIISRLEILKSIQLKFGAESVAAKAISAIGQCFEFGWVVEFKGNIKNEVVGNYVLINDRQVLLEDAGVIASEYESERLRHAEAKKAEQLSDMVFRVVGVPFDANRTELHVELNRLGFEIKDERDVRQKYENLNGVVIKSDIVLFKLVVNKKDRIAKSLLVGNHEIALGLFDYYVTISCFGFCFTCKKEGHPAKECPEKVNSRRSVTCFGCGEEGHVKRDCHKLKETLEKRLRNAICHKCYKIGHFSKDCLEAAIGWCSKEWPLLSSQLVVVQQSLNQNTVLPDIETENNNEQYNINNTTNNNLELNNDAYSGLHGLFNGSQSLKSYVAPPERKKRTKSSPMSETNESKTMKVGGMAEEDPGADFSDDCDSMEEKS